MMMRNINCLFQLILWCEGEKGGAAVGLNMGLKTRMRSIAEGQEEISWGKKYILFFTKCTVPETNYIACLERETGKEIRKRANRGWQACVGSRCNINGTKSFRLISRWAGFTLDHLNYPSDKMSPCKSQLLEEALPLKNRWVLPTLTFIFLSLFTVTVVPRVHKRTHFMLELESWWREAVVSWTRRLEVVRRGRSGSRPCCNTNGCTGWPSVPAGSWWRDDPGSSHLGHSSHMVEVMSAISKQVSLNPEPDYLWNQNNTFFDSLL